MTVMKIAGRKYQLIRHFCSNRGVAYSREQNQKEERLVPIRIDLEAEGYRLSDTFTWNLNGNMKRRMEDVDKYPSN
jgi:SNF5 / SMARCB1 / INI1